MVSNSGLLELRLRNQLGDNVFSRHKADTGGAGETRFPMNAREGHLRHSCLRFCRTVQSFLPIHERTVIDGNQKCLLG